MDDEIGFVIRLTGQLTNLSNRTQTGTVEVLSPASAAAFAYARAGSGSTLRAMDYYYDICANTGSVHAFVTGTTNSERLPPAGTATFSLPASSSREFQVAVYFVGQYGDTTNPKRFNNISVEFQPAIKLVINEDIGAVIGSMNAFAGSIVGVSSSMTYCGGQTITGPRWGTEFPQSNLSAPMLLNGGRPF